MVLLINKCDSFTRVMLIGTDRRTTQRMCHPLASFQGARCTNHSMSSLLLPGRSSLETGITIQGLFLFAVEERS